MQADDFAPLAREFVDLLDGAADMRPHELLLACARLLPRIYTAGLSLPDVEPDDTIAPRSVPAPTLPSFGKFDVYSEIYDPYVHDEPVMGSLTDDLSDIYSDLAAPLREFEAGRVANATWSWRFNLMGHCGDHLVDALRAIHRAVHDHMPSEYDPTVED
ncbi:MAG TPA: DUF5063 domain-containing protein [Polyangiaceae bacterium]